MIDASNFQNSTFWDPDTTSGLGGWGDPNQNDQVTDGGFATGFPVAYPAPHRFSRRYTTADPSQPDSVTDRITPASQLALVNGFVGNFVGFQASLESGSHGAIHLMVGGCVNLFTVLGFHPLTEPP